MAIRPLKPALLAALFAPALALVPALADQPYKDLPGVKVPAPLNAPSEYKCTTTTIVTRNPHRRFDSALPSTNLPVLAYRCEKDGVTAWGTEAPVSPGWYPGINPRELEK